MDVTLLGTGDTTGTPTVGCDCDTCTEARRRGVERTRFSVHIRNERTDESLLIDASPDFRHQFLTHDVPLPDEVLITHIHFDHLDGLGNLYRLVDSVPVHAANEPDEVLGESVAEHVRNRYDYLRPIEVRGHPPAEPFRVCGLDVTLVPVEHPPLKCYGVRIEDPETGSVFAFSGDTNYAISEESRDLLADADLFLADAIFPAWICEDHPLGGDHYDDEGVARTFGHKHMTREGALALADELNAKQTRLVHLAHYYGVEEAFEEPLAVDGERYRL